jgi:hypothetical protein
MERKHSRHGATRFPVHDVRWNMIGATVGDHDRADVSLNIAQWHSDEIAMGMNR